MQHAKTFLFLQGHPSAFARQLAAELEYRGHRTLRVNFCVGDVMFWLGRPAVSYRGSLASWPQFLTDLVQREGVTDILYYGDRRPYHRIARDVAERLGVRAHVYEFGYLRPDWLTLERGGMSGASHFPADPAAIRRIGARFSRPKLKPEYRYSMAVELVHEIAYHLSSYFFFLFYPRYEADRYYNPVLEYLAGIPKQIMAPRNHKRAEQTIRRIRASGEPYFLYPLQLQCDYQLRNNAPYSHQSEAIRDVIASFAAHAPARALLLFKCHPLDNGAERWPTHIASAANAHRVEDRVVFIDGGNLQGLLADTKGVVLINSTVGMHALMLGRPVKVLGTAVFDLSGATHQGSLDDFWQKPTEPDAGFVDALVRALAGTTQVRGSFFDPAGRRAAIRTFADRLIQGAVNGAGAFVSPPPRLAGRVQPPSRR